MQDKEPRNIKGQRHGYWVGYWLTGQLAHKCYYINDVEHGYKEFYWFDGNLEYKHYYAR